mmetsp:Transcript_35156/g.100136  ORF Transcript_35156/g.100136 Transcript_35156/m.100136 type:complete len:330 (-) Transcript_35156:141-1130(-)
MRPQWSSTKASLAERGATSSQQLSRAATLAARGSFEAKSPRHPSSTRTPTCSQRPSSSAASLEESGPQRPSSAASRVRSDSSEAAARALSTSSILADCASASLAWRATSRRSLAMPAGSSQTCSASAATLVESGSRRPSSATSREETSQQPSSVATRWPTSSQPPARAAQRSSRALRRGSFCPQRRSSVPSLRQRGSISSQHCASVAKTPSACPKRLSSAETLPRSASDRAATSLVILALSASTRPSRLATRAKKGFSSSQRPSSSASLDDRGPTWPVRSSTLLILAEMPSTCSHRPSNRLTLAFRISSVPSEVSALASKSLSLREERP